jgi:hypothetical protein
MHTLMELGAYSSTVYFIVVSSINLSHSKRSARILMLPGTVAIAENLSNIHFKIAAQCRGCELNGVKEKQFLK